MKLRLCIIAGPTLSDAPMVHQVGNAGVVISGPQTVVWANVPGRHVDAEGVHVQFLGRISPGSEMRGERENARTVWLHKRIIFEHLDALYFYT